MEGWSLVAMTTGQGLEMLAEARVLLLAHVGEIAEKDL